jgi:activator of HSP90 ATPase
METREILHEVTFAARPEDVFEALLDPVRHAAFSGAPAEIDRRQGGKFSLYGGHLQGDIVEFETNRRIVENWRATDWPEGAMSRVTYELHPMDGGRGCRLSFLQTGVPAANYESINAGWRKHYWEKLAEYFGGPGGGSQSE